MKLYQLLDNPWLCVFLCMAFLVLAYGILSFIRSEPDAYHNGYDDPEIREDDLDNPTR